MRATFHEMLDELIELIEEALDPELTRVKLVKKLKGISLAAEDFADELFVLEHPSTKGLPDTINSEIVPPTKDTKPNDTPRSSNG